MKKLIVYCNTYGSIIGFYSPFILVIGIYISSFFNYESEKIIIGEMLHPENLLNLCERVEISVDIVIENLEKDQKILFKYDKRKVS